MSTPRTDAHYAKIKTAWKLTWQASLLIYVLAALFGGVPTLWWKAGEIIAALIEN